MKKHILLLDESVTVQKVVSLTLDHAHFTVVFAKSKKEALEQIQQVVPDLVLVSDQIPGGTSSIPKELEAWLGRATRSVPPCILISSRKDTSEARHYAGVLIKPFTPPQLKALVSELLKEDTEIELKPATSGSGDPEEQRLQGLFDQTFSDEDTLVSETFQLQGNPLKRAADSTPGLSGAGLEESDGWRETTQGGAPLWTKLSHDKVSEKPAQPILEKQIQLLLNSKDLTPIIDRILEKMIPPIVEKMVNERLDHLLKDSEDVA